MINKKEVNHIAKLARLGISEKEEKKFQKDLSSILDYFNCLQEVDVSGKEPTFHPTEYFLLNRETITGSETTGSGRKKGVMREDKEKPQKEGLADKLVESAPDKSKRHIKVKTVF